MRLAVRLLPSPRPPAAWRQLAAQMVHFFAIMLWVAGVLAFVADMPQLGIAIFVVVVVALATIRPLRLLLTPKGLKRRRVKRAALHHLKAAHLVAEQGVVVIFASDQERMVTVVADEALHLKAGDAAWDGAVAAVLSGIKGGDPTSGFVAAIDLCGAYLAEHFPARGPRRNGLSDRLLED